MDAAPATPPKPKPPRRIPPTPGRVLATVSVVFVCAFLFLRIAVVEPFGVPTGSMAPALIGNHREAACPRCGYPVRVGLPSAGGERPGYFSEVPCPNCGKRVNLSESRDINGDRLLVDKNVFSLRSPRRWEVAVFRCPYDLSKPYVKRVIGLPGEELVVRDGDVFAGGELLRKTLAEVRETRIPVFDLAFSPGAGGWSQRWLVYPPDRDPRLPRDTGHDPAPADESVLQNGSLVLDAAGSPQQEVRVEYRHWNLDEEKEDVIRSFHSYDGGNRSTSNVYPVHDFFLMCDLEVTSSTPEGVFACRLFDGSDAVAAEIPVGRPAAANAHLVHDRLGELTTATRAALEVGLTYRLEFALVDRRASLALDGKLAVAPADLPVEKKRGEVKRPLQLGARGCRVVVKNLKLYRDIHYTQAGRHGTRVPAKLGPTEYFMLGDNSGNSQDSREWPEPGVPEADFIGKPFLIHQPLRVGRVSVGGGDRVFQTLDWSRVRLLH
jgi:signal peptidase I